MLLIIFVLLVIFLGVLFFFSIRPQIYISVPEPGKLVGPSAKNDLYIELVNQLAQNDLGVGYINFLDEQTIEASLSSGIKVLFSTKKDIKREVASLQLILARFRIEGRKVNKIDLRFNNAFIE